MKDTQNTSNQASTTRHTSELFFNKGKRTPFFGVQKSEAFFAPNPILQKRGAPTIQRMLACPQQLNDNAPTPLGWRDYPNSTAWFHCGYRTILENRSPTPEDPMNECVYDHNAVFVDNNHPYSGCKGTPDQYDSRTNPLKHSTIDSGGILREGMPALIDSGAHAVADIGHAIAQPFNDAYNWLDQGVRKLYGFPY